MILSYHNVHSSLTYIYIYSYHITNRVVSKRDHVLCNKYTNSTMLSYSQALIKYLRQFAYCTIRRWGINTRECTLLFVLAPNLVESVLSITKQVVYVDGSFEGWYCTYDEECASLLRDAGHLFVARILYLCKNKYSYISGFGVSDIILFL